jgi:hypothetical protein
MQTVIAGTGLTITYTGLTKDGVGITAVADPDTFTISIQTSGGVVVDSASVAGGGLVGDGAANYTCHLTAPSSIGRFLLVAESVIGGIPGKKTLEFNVRKS